MAQYINTNIAALNSQRSLSQSQSALATSLQRLSSGMRINSAKDDAAGMAIANRMTSQINGLVQAVRNANDGISLAQTAEGAMASISDNLQRMRDLSVQASNASATATDRVSINNEIQQLSAEIQRVATSTSFNGTKLLNGTFNAQVFQVGANQGDTIAVNNITNMQTANLGSSGTTYQASVTGSATTKALVAGDVTLNGVQVGASLAGLSPGQNAGSAYSAAIAINAVSGSSGVTAVANATTLTSAAQTSYTAVTGTIAANSFQVNGINVGAISAGITSAGQGANVAAAINAISGQSGVTAVADATTGKVTLTASDGRNINVTTNAGYALSSLTGTTGLSGTGSDIVVANAAATAAAVSVSATVNGVAVSGATGTAASSAAQNAASFVTNFNTTAAINTNLTGITASSDSNGVITLTSNGNVASITIANQANGGWAPAQVGAAVNYFSTRGSVTLNSTSSNGIVQAGFAAGSAGLTAAGLTTNATVTSTVNSISSLNVLSAASAQSAITTIDGALAMVDGARAALGAYQNRFSSAVANMQITTENLTASRSRIQDTDFAHETSQLTRAQILQQAGTAMLAQANQTPNGVMALLR